mmetsp:Transcript_25629/g.63990  ORF Transcript_25629/g.63990 Transcript_25629/m.63990 type:complete len:111 (-) Transcript_25629:1-333(-)
MRPLMRTEAVTASLPPKHALFQASPGREASLFPTVHLREHLGIPLGQFLTAIHSPTEAKRGRARRAPEFTRYQKSSDLSLKVLEEVDARGLDRRCFGIVDDDEGKKKVEQ